MGAKKAQGGFAATPRPEFTQLKYGRKLWLLENREDWDGCESRECWERWVS